MIFGELNPEKIDMTILQVGPLHLLDVANLHWEIQKIIFFNSIIYT